MEKLCLKMRLLNTVFYGSVDKNYATYYDDRVDFCKGKI